MPQSSCRAGGAARTEPAPAEPSNLPRVHQRIQGELGKTTAGAEEKLLSQKRKAICVPGWTPLAPMEEEKEIFQREGKKKKHTKKHLKAGMHKQKKSTIKKHGQKKPCGHPCLGVAHPAAWVECALCLLCGTWSARAVLEKWEPTL